MEWVAISYGALDMRGQQDNPSQVDIMLLSTEPSEPFGLIGPHADLWHRLCEKPISDDELTPEERALVREFAAAGIASSDPQHPARLRNVEQGWLTSPLHELVYSLIGNVARENGIDVIFIKGPVLQLQGLRNRHHSGDVDVLVDPDRIAELAERLEAWGWTHAQVRWEDSSLYHSVTMTPSGWGCEIDIHRHMPGFAVSDQTGFKLLLQHAEAKSFATVSVRIPDTPAHAVISALHLMRPQQGRNIASGNEEAAVRSLQTTGIEALSFARKMRAEASLKEELRRAFPEETINPSYDAPLNWKWRAEPNRLKRYLIMFRAAPLRVWPRMAYRSIWPDESTAILIDNLYGGTATSPIDARLKRLKRGILQQFNRWR
ncbi:MAG: nucleotidyltransferase family protein [Leucobacter sp.]